MISYVIKLRSDPLLLFWSMDHYNRNCWWRTMKKENNYKRNNKDRLKRSQWIKPLYISVDRYVFKLIRSYMTVLNKSEIKFLQIVLIFLCILLNLFWQSWRLITNNRLWYVVLGKWQMQVTDMISEAWLWMIGKRALSINWLQLIACFDLINWYVHGVTVKPHIFWGKGLPILPRSEEIRATRHNTEPLIVHILLIMVFYLINKHI